MTPVGAAAISLFALESVAIAFQLRAGRLYVRGDLARARALARRAGLSAAAVAAGAAAAAWAAGSPAASALVAGAGASALLGGLSGKPRPAGEVALVALALGVAAFAARRC